MYDGDKAELLMIQYLKEDGVLDENIYPCTVIEYQKELEQVHLLMRSGNITEIELDAIYKCTIHTMQGDSVCSGTIKERYENRAGMILILQIVNGFYEINIK